MLASVSGGISAKYFAVNPLDGNTATNGNLIVGGGSTITGPAHMGRWSPDGTMARFGHSSFNTNTGFGYLQTKDGSVYFDIPTDQKVYFRVNGEIKNYMDAGGFFHFMTPSTADYTNTVPTTAWVKDVAAPTSHATSEATYGKSTASNYGHSKASSLNPVMDGAAAVGTDDGKYARGDHGHLS